MRVVRSTPPFVGVSLHRCMLDRSVMTQVARILRSTVLLVAATLLESSSAFVPVARVLQGGAVTRVCPRHHHRSWRMGIQGSTIVYVCHLGNEEGRIAAEFAVNSLGASGVTAIATSAPKDNQGAVYVWKSAVGMFQLQKVDEAIDLPKWLDAVKSEEKLLEEKGWNFINTGADNKAFDLQVAVSEELYKPCWGDPNALSSPSVRLLAEMSPLTHLDPMPASEVLGAANALPDAVSRSVLLRGCTEPERRRLTADGVKVVYGEESLRGAEFQCAVGGLRLFAYEDLDDTSATSGWLSFRKPIDPAHIVLRDDNTVPGLRRTEVLCRRSLCHLGHFFGDDGYCINACALTVSDPAIPSE